MDLFLAILFHLFAWPAGFTTIAFTMGATALATLKYRRMTNSDPSDRRAFICWMMAVLAIALLTAWRMDVIASLLFGVLASLLAHVVWGLIKTYRALPVRSASDL